MYGKCQLFITKLEYGYGLKPALHPPPHTHFIINSLHPLISGRMKSVVSSGLGRHSLAKGTAGFFCLTFFNYQGLLRDKVITR